MRQAILGQEEKNGLKLDDDNELFYVNKYVSVT